MKKKKAAKPQPAPWTMERKQEAAKLWNGGMTAEQIAKRFRVTRNSVIGVINRNRAMFPRGNKVYEVKPKAVRPPRTVPDAGQTPAKPKATRPQTMPLKQPALIKPSAPGASIGLTPRTKSSPKTEFTCAQIATRSEPVRFIDLTALQCHWPLTGFGERSGPDMPCCGEIVSPGKSYCAHHLSLAYRSRTDA